MIAKSSFCHYFHFWVSHLLHHTVITPTFLSGCQPIFTSFDDYLVVWGNPDLILYHLWRSIKFQGWWLFYAQCLDFSLNTSCLNGINLPWVFSHFSNIGIIYSESFIQPFILGPIQNIWSLPDYWHLFSKSFSCFWKKIRYIYRILDKTCNWQMFFCEIFDILFILCFWWNLLLYKAASGLDTPKH